MVNFDVKDDSGPGNARTEAINASCLSVIAEIQKLKSLLPEVEGIQSYYLIQALAKLNEGSLTLYNSTRCNFLPGPSRVPQY